MPPYRPNRMNQPKAWTEAEDRLLLQLRGEGASLQVMAARLGRGKTQVLRRLKELGAR